jgi:hypothetical protein
LNRQPPGCKPGALPIELRPRKVVGLGGFEPPTLRLSGVRSNQLSYRPIYRRLAQQRTTLVLETARHIDLRTYVPSIENRVTQTASCVPVTIRFPKVPEGLFILRKEVIQPQVPLRLPCYDLVPITRLAFGAALLSVRQTTSGTLGFRGLTGGVYKAQEHIHRGVADPRLLAIPTSCRRVAACNPNWGMVSGICFSSRFRAPLSMPL